MLKALKAGMACALLGIGFGACAHGDDDDGYRSGVDGNVRLGGLTPDQRVTICSSQAAYVHARVDTTSLTTFLCAFSPAVLSAADDAGCEAAMADCVSAFAVKVDVTASGATAVPLECVLTPIGQCSGTVGDYEACVEALADVQIQVGTDFSCGKRGQYAGGPTVGVSACGALGPSCTSAARPPVIR